MLGHHCNSVTVDNPTNQYLFLEGAGQYVVPYTFNFTVRDSGGLLAQAAVLSPPGINQAIPIAGQQAVIKWTDELLPPTSGTQVAIASVQIAPTDVTDRAARLLGQIANLPAPGAIKRVGFEANVLAGGGSQVLVGGNVKIWQIMFSTDVIGGGSSPTLFFYDGSSASVADRLVVFDVTKIATGIVVPCWGSPIIRPGANLGIVNNSNATINVRGSVFYE